MSALRDGVLRMDPNALARLQARCRAVGWKYPEFIAEVQRVFLLADLAVPTMAEIDAALAEADDSEAAPKTTAERIAADLRAGTFRGVPHECTCTNPIEPSATCVVHDGRMAKARGT